MNEDEAFIRAIVDCPVRTGWYHNHTLADSGETLMRMEELRTLLKARPFSPFVVYTPDGTGIPVWHPDFSLLSPDGRTLWVYQRDYSCEMLDVMLLTRFSFSTPDNAPPPEGAQQPGAA